MLLWQFLLKGQKIRLCCVSGRILSHSDEKRAGQNEEMDAWSIVFLSILQAGQQPTIYFKNKLSWPRHLGSVGRHSGGTLKNKIA